MKDLTQSATFKERVRACLNEILAGGQYSIVEVANRLAISRRTLQRRLNEENTSFQEVLDNLRKDLAYHYLINSNYTHEQIAFLLGYAEVTSFFRAFRAWTGHTPQHIRSGIQDFP